jgi:glycolate oxidase iron-sulfur subunit
LAGVVRLFSWAMPSVMRAALTKIPAQLKQLDPIGGKNAIFPTNTKQVKRVAMLAGCAQRALAPEINASTIRVLNRLGVEVVVRAEAHCCGALAHHIGEATQANDAIRAALLAWHDEIRTGGLDAIVVNASGCGTMVKDYGHMMKDDPELASIAKIVSDACVDVSELIDKLDLESILQPVPTEGRVKVAYHSACSLQHGQKIHDLPLRLLRQAGFDVAQPLNGHLCCGSAGVYNLLQPEMADELKARKLESLDKTGAQFVAAGNIGCIIQLDRNDLLVRHTVQFIDWATGGPYPR